MPNHDDFYKAVYAKLSRCTAIVTPDGNEAVYNILDIAMELGICPVCAQDRLHDSIVYMRVAGGMPLCLPTTNTLGVLTLICSMPSPETRALLDLYEGTSAPKELWEQRL